MTDRVPPLAETGWDRLAEDLRADLAGIEAEVERLAALCDACQRTLCAVALLRRALADMIETCGEHLEDAVAREDAPEHFAAIAFGREALAATSGCLLCNEPVCRGAHPWDREDRP